MIIVGLLLLLREAPHALQVMIELNNKYPLTVIRQTAIFDPVGVLGQLYWYLLYPMHQFVFAGMLTGIVCAMGELP